MWITAFVMLALIPLVTGIEALVAVAVMAAILVLLISYEAIRFADARDRIRHELGRMPVGAE